ncbi:hypothetical protein ABEB36_004520 [Hypothenemus hampei]|uniref:Kazal-like domain-containing protein n=1 Tax=Hypothenemus hampei TaxID=57062 RepID=A0ABD1F3L2_HYPHA
MKLCVSILTFFFLCILMTADMSLREEVCACPLNYEPQCGSDGKTYSNLCQFNCEVSQLRTRGVNTLTLAKTGPCEDILNEF